MQFAIIEEYGKSGRSPTDLSFWTCCIVGYGAMKTTIAANGAVLVQNCIHDGTLANAAGEAILS